MSYRFSGDLLFGSINIAERAIEAHSDAEALQRATEIDWSVFGSIASLGVTAGASAPEVLVEEVVEACRGPF